MEVRCVSTTQIILEINSSFRRAPVSHSILQKPERGASKGIRVSAPDLEAVVVKAIRDHLAGRRPSTTAVPAGDKELIEYSTLKGLLSNSGQSNSI